MVSIERRVVFPLRNSRWKAEQMGSREHIFKSSSRDRNRGVHSRRGCSLGSFELDMQGDELAIDKMNRVCQGSRAGGEETREKA
jgi:hypothetical protein